MESFFVESRKGHSIYNTQIQTKISFCSSFFTQPTQSHIKVLFIKSFAQMDFTVPGQREASVGTFYIANRSNKSMVRSSLVRWFVLFLSFFLTLLVSTLVSFSVN